MKSFCPPSQILKMILKKHMNGSFPVVFCNGWELFKLFTHDMNTTENTNDDTTKKSRHKHRTVFLIFNLYLKSVADKLADSHLCIINICKYFPIFGRFSIKMWSFLSIRELDPDVTALKNGSDRAGLIFSNKQHIMVIFNPSCAFPPKYDCSWANDHSMHRRNCFSAAYKFHPNSLLYLEIH